jgi:D-alanine-D-alanine ligase
VTHVVVLQGGRSSEHDVSLASAESVVAALRGRGHEVDTIELARGASWLPEAATVAAISGADVVFPVLHGPFGEDGSVQGLLELAGVPYVGAGVTASALCMDKDLFKSVLRDHEIPATRNITLRTGESADNPFGYPVFVKPARLGSSVGISKAHDEGELEQAVALAFEHDEKVLVEEFVGGIEIEVGVLGNHHPTVSLPGQILVTSKEWYDYEAKYDEGEMELRVPPQISSAQVARARELALRAFVAAECEGMARVDMFVREDGEVLVNELNTIPGFTSTSVYAKLFEASGVAYGDLLEQLLALAIERHERRRNLRY